MFGGGGGRRGGVGAIIQYDLSPYQKRLGHTERHQGHVRVRVYYTGKKHHLKPQQEGGCPQSKERGLRGD